MSVDGIRAPRRRVQWRLPRLDVSPPWALAWREALFAFVLSRIVVLVSGVGAASWFGPSGRAPGFDPSGLTHPFGGYLDELAAPFARWDSVWLLAIADDGYGQDVGRPAFFPLFPLLARAVGTPLGYSLAGGAAVSLCAFLVALVLLHRLALVEFGDERAASFAVLACAFFPMSFFNTAVYTEGVFMALAIGAVYCARTQAWAWAGVLGALAAATRSVGVMLVVPLALLYLDARRNGALSWRQAAWIALVPLGLAAFCGWFALHGLPFTAPLDAPRKVWFREFTGPFIGLWDGVVAGFQGARQLLSGAREPVYFTKAGGDPFVVAQENLVALAFLLACVPAVIGVIRRLPRAYGAYVVLAVALPLSTPVAPQPLMSIPRYLAAVFPLYLWVGWWLARGSQRRAVVAFAVSAIGLAFFTARFATWHWVA